MIHDIPDLGNDIKTAFKDKKLIIFFGAGLSSLLGCKRWREMANSLILECYNKEKFDFWVYQSLKRNYSPRKLVTMAKGMSYIFFADFIDKTPMCCMSGSRLGD